jgi:hypothetical protein
MAVKKWKPGDRVQQGTRHGTVESVSQYSGKVFVQWDGGSTGSYVQPGAIERLAEDPVISHGYPSASDDDNDVATIYGIPCVIP